MPDAAALRADLPAFVLGTLVMAMGLATLALALLRRAGRGLLLSFAAFAFLYGLRLAVDTTLVRDVVGLSAVESAIVRVLVTYWIGLPSVLFFSNLGWQRWRSLLNGLAYVWLAYALAGTTIDLLAGRPGLAQGAIPYLVLATMAVGIAANVAPGVPSREMRLLRGGGFVLLLFVANENLGALGVPTVRGIEAYGFVAFVGVLAYVAVSRVVEDERRLLALKQELETARRIQASILPRRLPSVDGLRVAVRCEPMAAVGGDFYDFAPRADRLGVLVADVSGHGVPAALVASMVKVAFEAQGAHAEQPALVLGGMNRVLCRTLEGPFVTALYADVDAASGRIRLGGAGHPPALLFRRASGTVECLLENGLFMGFDAAAAYTSLEREVGTGDRLLLFTDGVIEAAGPSDEPFGLERLSGLVRDGASLDAAGLADRVLDDLRRFRGRNADGFEDDVTLAVVDLVARA